MTNQGYQDYKAEEQRQANAFAQAMKKAMDDCAMAMDGPAMLNAGIGACVGLLIEQLGAIGDVRIRKQMHDTICRSLKQGMLDIVRHPRKAAPVAILGGKDA